MSITKDYDRTTHLGFIEEVISRMSNLSFQVKSWCITVDSALVILSLNSKPFGSCDSLIQANHQYAIYVAYVVTGLFMILGAYYHYQELLYRDYYDEVAHGMGDEEEMYRYYPMRIPDDLKTTRNVFRALFSLNILGFFLAIELLLFILNSLLK